jgi:hypothetical protein
MAAESVFAGLGFASTILDIGSVPLISLARLGEVSITAGPGDIATGAVKPFAFAALRQAQCERFLFAFPVLNYTPLTRR